MSKAANFVSRSKQSKIISKSYENYTNFNGKILQIGFGGVGQTMLPLLLRHIKVIPQNVTVLEKDNHNRLFQNKYGDTGVKYIIKELTKTNLIQTLESYLTPGSMIINLSTDVSSTEIVLWCLENDVLYIDTSLERWPDVSDEDLSSLAARTLYSEIQKIRDLTKPFPKGGTCVVTHGANPGLVSHFTKAALLDLAKASNKDTSIPTTREGWAQLSKELEVKVIHISERDTQIIDVPKRKNEFVNTWSCRGFWEEGRAPAELGWGSHEYKLPHNGFEHKSGPKNAIYLNQPSVSLLLKSWAPSGGSFNGFCVQHNESVTISEYLTVQTKNELYRPSVYYVYCPCDAAIVSVHEFRGLELKIQDSCRIVKTEIIAGMDELGVFLLGHKLNGLWYGSQLDIKQANDLIPGEGPTSIQVVGSMLGAIVWMIKNPNMGYCEPEDLPFDFVLKYALPYLGTIVSKLSDWTPHDDRNSLFRNKVDLSNPWSFDNFKISS